MGRGWYCLACAVSPTGFSVLFPADWWCWGPSPISMGCHLYVFVGEMCVSVLCRFLVPFLLLDCYSLTCHLLYDTIPGLLWIHKCLLTLDRKLTMLKVQIALKSNLVNHWVLIGVTYRNRNDLKIAASTKSTQSQVTAHIIWKARTCYTAWRQLNRLEDVFSWCLSWCEPHIDTLAGLCCF